MYRVGYSCVYIYIYNILYRHIIGESTVGRGEREGEIINYL